MIPPEFAPHRTPTQQLGDDIVKHAAAIRRGWPHMLPEDAPAQRMGRASVSAGILREGDDDDTSEDDLDQQTLLTTPTDGRRGDETGADLLEDPDAGSGAQNGGKR